jgi:signal peptidase I
VDNRRRRPWLAALLTFIFNIGIGHIYSGRLRRGIYLFAIGQLLFLASAVALTVIFPRAIFLLILVLINIAFLFFCIFDAVVSAKAGKTDFRPSKYNRWYAYIGFIAIGILLELAVSGIVPSSISQAFKISTGAMEPTLLIGDRIIVNKLAYRISEPERNDLITFKYPEDPEVRYIKRLIGLPGDVIEIQGRAVYIDGTQLEETFESQYNFPFRPERSIINACLSIRDSCWKLCSLYLLSMSPSAIGEPGRADFLFSGSWPSTYRFLLQSSVDIFWGSDGNS